MDDGHIDYEGDNLEDMIDGFEERVEDDPDVTVQELISDSEKPLYPGCDKYTRLSSVLKLYNLKAGHGWTDTSFSALLEFLYDVLPPDNVLPKCKVSRYKFEGVPGKVLWYFPIIPRFKRMYSNPYEAKKLTWHKFGRKNDGLLRHPADSPQ
uniref:Uncharacterized protein n=1 Tax=Chenopodium quinoa TaxID=63459 RepID=A0A803N471_CHEQI